MTDTVNLVITACNKCPYMKSERHYTADSFETCFEWKCTRGNINKTIAIQDWNDKTPPIPDWCALRG
jgi:hypothetical protein